jgi:Protein of Unknown function (DUF2784)
MGARLLADTLVVAHFAFLVFVAAGGVLVLWRTWVAWAHVPAVLWAAWIEFSGAICPLTPWENALRLRAGQRGYRGGFIEHYVIPVVYPPGLTRDDQFWLGAALLAVNATLYVLAWRKTSRAAR